MNFCRQMGSLYSRRGPQNHVNMGTPGCPYLRGVQIFGTPGLVLDLYTSCVNNLPKSVEQCQVKEYAEDTAMFCAADSVSELEEVLENNLDSVARWVDSN